MSVTKAKILKLLSNTRIHTRYRSILNRYRENPEYAKLAYHNTNHVIAVLNLFEVLRKLSGKGFSKHLLDQVYLAIAFHDIEHSGHPDLATGADGKKNIVRALDAFEQWRESDTITDEQAAIVAFVIRSTQYPSMPGLSCSSAELAELANMVRDADMLWGLMPGNAGACMLGMRAEREAVGLPVEQDTLICLKNQIEFIKDYKPHSSTGRMFKNALFEDASTAWAEAALAEERRRMIIAQTTQISSSLASQLGRHRSLIYP